MESKTTCIESVLPSSSQIIPESPVLDTSHADASQLAEWFCDGDIALSQRVRVCEEMYQRFPDTCMEYIIKCCTSFSVQPTTLAKQLLSSLVSTSTILPVPLRYQVCQCLYDNEEKELAYPGFIHLTQDTTFASVSLPLQLEIFRYGMETLMYQSLLQPLLNQFVCSSPVECEYRYKFLSSLCRDSSRYKPDYIHASYLSFIRCESVYTRFRILASQYLFQHLAPADQPEIELTVQSFALDTHLDYDLRADAADTLLRLAPSSTSKEIGKSVIMMLGRIVGGKSTVFTNRQNVHDQVISESVSSFLQYLSSVPLPPLPPMETVQREIETYYQEHKELANQKPNTDTSKPTLTNMDRIRSSLFRISVDQTTYIGSSLHTLFLRIWVLLSLSTHKDLLKQRMIEELIDMADTCSSGHISRLVNIFSGIHVIGNTEFHLSVGYKNQIEANLVARLNKKIKEIPEETSRDTLLTEFCSSSCISEKPALKLFFRTHLNVIRDELYKEFVTAGYLPEDQFELYMREAISFFEQGR